MPNRPRFLVEFYDTNANADALWLITWATEHYYDVQGLNMLNADL